MAGVAAPPSHAAAAGPAHPKPKIPLIDGLELKDEYQIGRSDLWVLPRVGSIHRNKMWINLPAVKCGPVCVPMTDLANISTVYIHHTDSYTKDENFLRFFVASDFISKSQPDWRQALKDGGIVKTTLAFRKLHQSIIELKKAGVRMSYSIINGQLTIHVNYRGDHVADDITKAAEHIHHAISTGVGRRSTMAMWNRLLPIVFPDLLGKSHDETAGTSSITDLPCKAVTDYEGRFSVLPLRESFEKFFEGVAKERRRPPKYTVNTHKLTCTVRPYQMDAIRFMMHRELHGDVILENDLFKSYKLLDDLYYFSELGVFCKSNKKPEISVTGGILADEMGLGKTVELLGLIFSLPADNNGNLIRTYDSHQPTYPYPDAVRECVEDCVSQVVAMEQGLEGLNVVLKSKMVKSAARAQNVFFNVDARYYNDEYIPFFRRINCIDCGVSCLRDKMYWLKSFDDDQFLCPDCIFYKKLPSKATLIVVPQILIHQWYEEIKKHVRDDVHVEVYMGVERGGYRHPVYLSQVDIVITSYETLRNDLVYMEPRAAHNLRKRKYAVQRQVSTPLLSLIWWRVCLDESQQVEGPGRMVNRFLSQLTARARWCVTGTPMTNGPRDLYYLVDFLELFPFNIKHVWDAHVMHPYQDRKKERMYELFSILLWRNSFESVKDQLAIPPVKYELIEISFSPLEERLYQEQLMNTLRFIDRLIEEDKDKDEALKVYSRAIGSVDSKSQKSIIATFNALRLHIITAGIHKKTKDNKNNEIEVYYSAEQLLKRLLLNQRAKLEEKVREYMYALCAYAGLLMLYDKPNAIEAYSALYETESMLQKINEILERHKVNKRLEIDRTQMVHFCRAMLDLSPGGPDPPPANGWTTEQLNEKITECYEKYTRREVVNLQKYYDDWVKVGKNWPPFDKAFHCSTFWLLVHLDAMSHKDFQAILNVAMREEWSISTALFNAVKKEDSWTAPYRLFFYIKEQFERQQADLQKLRRKVQAYIFPIDMDRPSALARLEDAEFVKMMSCHHNAMYIAGGAEFPPDEEKALDELQHLDETRQLRSSKKRYIAEEVYTAFDCHLCELERHAKRLERDLSMVDDKKQIIAFHKSEWVMLVREIMRKEIPVLLKTQAGLLCKWFHHSRKTVLFAHKAIVAMKEVVCRYRELKQAERRIEFGMLLEMPYEIQVKVEMRSDMKTENITKVMNTWRNKMSEYQKPMKEHVTQITYISTLQDEEGEDGEERCCPVCYEPLTAKWDVFPCAHITCTKCSEYLKSKHWNQRKNLLCVVCRQECSPANITHVVNHGPDYVPIPDMPKRLINVKYEAIVRKLLEILQTDPTHKVLIFTSLPDCLDSFCRLLTECKVDHIRISTLDPAKVAQFRNDPNFRVLIIPLHLGSSGLNLTQANHLIFMEPSLQRATLAQAIGRIARMGQTRSMTVYNFVVSGSIEKNLFEIKTDIFTKNGWTVGHLEEILMNNHNNLPKYT